MNIVDQGVATAASSPSLPWGVRALAEEFHGRATRRSLTLLAERLERGDGWHAALDDPQVGLPEHVRGLLQVGLQTNNFAATVEQLANFNRRSVQLRREMWLSVAYPLAVAVSVIVLFACFELFVVAPLTDVYLDAYDQFQTKLPLGLPAITRLMIAWSGPPSIALLVAAAVVCVVLPAIWARWRPSWLDVLAHRLPILGPLWLWAGVVDFCRLAALLLQSQVPLPDALRMTAAGLHSSELAQASRRLAQRVEAGQTLAESITMTSPLPDTLAPVVQWGEARSALPEAMQAAAEMFEGRVQMQLAFVRLFLPPAVFLLAGGMILMSLLAIFYPMLLLIESLS